jgi:hypothetical protein
MDEHVHGSKSRNGLIDEIGDRDRLRNICMKEMELLLQLAVAPGSSHWGFTGP